MDTDLQRPLPLMRSAAATPVWASRTLLGAWLLYSAIALGWFLANDPLLFLYVCGVR